MKKHLLGTILLFITSSLFSQKPVFFEQKDDTIILYISCNGSITEKNNASYKRIGIFDKKNLGFSGKVIDFYYPNETIAFEGKCQNGLYEGNITSYYKNGTIKETGKYKSNNRDSIWTYYYNNKTIEKKIEYNNTKQRLIEYYNKNGKPIFLDGNGLYKGYSNENYYSCEQHQIKGELKDGYMVNRWTINFGYSVSTELFENGKFIRGYEKPHDRIYEDASLINPSGFPYFEKISLLDYLIACNKFGLYWPTYNKETIENSFLVKLEQKIIDKINTSDFFYAFLEFQLNNGVIDSNSFKSITNNKQKADDLKNIIISLDKWDRPNDNISFTIYLPIIWEKGLIYLKPNDILKFD
jgi:hypothetical protein